ncbi:MAG TPA: hypothetical protein VF204_12820, partial [Streptosporangiaceae bacterium]
MTEQQPYEVVDRRDRSELRRYPAHLVAEIEVDGSFDEAPSRAREGAPPGCRWLRPPDLSSSPAEPALHGRGRLAGSRLAAAAGLASDQEATAAMPQMAMPRARVRARSIASAA